MGELKYREIELVEQFSEMDRTFEKLNKNISYNQDVLKCIHDIKNYNNELYKHSVNVAFLSILIGNSLLITEKELTELFISALLHDYGKIFISKDILEKPGLLTQAEQKIMQLHTIFGYFSLRKQTKLPTKLLYGVLDHHERVDGKGYGQNKTSNTISPYAKMIAIADVYDAMVSDRVYRKRISQESVLEYIQNNAGHHFDLELADNFIKMIKESNLNYIKQEFSEKIIVLKCQN